MSESCERACKRACERACERVSFTRRTYNAPTMAVDFTLAVDDAAAAALAAHPNMPILVSSSVRGTVVRVWDLESRACLRTLAGHFSPVCDLAIDPAGHRVATGSIDNSVRIWDLESGACLRTFEDHAMSHVFAVAWDITGGYVASGSLDGAVRIWDAASGALHRQLIPRHAGDVNALVSHPVDQLLASGSDDTTVKIWDWLTGDLVHVLEGHRHSVMSLAASSSGLLLASGSTDRTVRVWSWASGLCVRVLDDFCHELYLNSLAWRDSTLVAIESDREDYSGNVRLWDTSSEDWLCAEAPLAKTSSNWGVAILEGGRVACAAPGDRKMIAVIAP